MAAGFVDYLRGVLGWLSATATTEAIPVVERIAREIEDRLDNVLIANGYEVNLTVVRPTRTGSNVSPQNGLCIVTQAPEAARDETNDIDGNPPAMAWLQDFIVTLVLAPTDSSTDPIDQVANIYAADAERGITSSTDHDWANFGGWSIEARQTGRNVDCDGQLATVRLTYSVLYRTNENDPYTVR